MVSWKKIQLRAQVDEDIFVGGDRDWLECAVLNLLDNAIKFTPEGGAVDVSVTTKGRSVQMDFRDTGIGIPGEALPHVFERFYARRTFALKRI